MIHHFTIRTYTAMLLDLFNDLEVQYQLDDKTIKTKNVPIVYSTREKAMVMDKVTREQFLSGNVNVLPKAALVFSGLEKNPQRTTNKNIKTNKVKLENTFQYSTNSVAYTFNFEVIIKCRGMNELTGLIEQIAPIFNPTVDLDVADAQNLRERTRVPVSLTGFSWDDEELDENSSNVFTLTVELKVQGSLYPPIKTIERIKEFKMFLNETNDDDTTYTRKSITNWDVDSSGESENEDIVIIESTTQYPPVINGLVVDGSFTEGENTITGIYVDEDSKDAEMVFAFTILSGDEYIDSYEIVDNVITVNVSIDTPTGTEVEIEFKVTDVYGNFDTLDKIFTI